MKNQDLPPANFFTYYLFCLRGSFSFSKKYRTILVVTFIGMMTISGCSKKPEVISILSPSGSIKTAVYVDSTGRLMYRVRYQDKITIAASPLGITVDKQDLGDGVKIGNPIFTTFNEKYPSSGVHEMAVNNFREAILPVTNIRSGNTYQLEIKSFDNGVAFRYVIPKKGAAIINGEASSWKIPSGSKIWYQENVFYYEGLYYESTLAALGSKKIGPPLTYQTPDSVFVSITEAALYNYSGMSLQSDSVGMLHAAFVNDPQGWKIEGTIVTPWRVAIISPDLNGLVNADIIQNLNPAPDSNLQKASWIKSGRAVWTYFMHGNVTTM
ncbi:MAG: glycoside hydrolase family 97 N-terminal domain-containing protein, partial [Ferruginibacter sp.]